MYNTGKYILGILLVSFTSLSIVNKKPIGDRVFVNEINLDSTVIKERNSFEKEQYCDSIKTQVKYEIALLNKELNIK